MPNMKLIKTLIATTLTLAAATAFAASNHKESHRADVTEEKVVVSTQEQPETQDLATTDVTASEASASSATTTTN
jgi:hypothetical protein